MTAREIRIPLPHLSIAARVWGESGGEPILAIHGWLDNAASFDPIGEKLPKGLELFAIDLPGHGHSDHRPKGYGYHYLDYLTDISAIFDAMKWEKITLVGHSLGAVVALAFIASQKTRVKKVVFIEALGPMPLPKGSFASILEKYVTQRIQLEAAHPKPYPSIESAVQARMLVPELKLERHSAERLALRGTNVEASGVRWRHDPRLRVSTPTRFTNEQILDLLAAVECPALIVRAKQGLPVAPEIWNARLSQVKDRQVLDVDGGHHVHMDAPERIIPTLFPFLQI